MFETYISERATAVIVLTVVFKQDAAECDIVALLMKEMPSVLDDKHSWILYNGQNCLQTNVPE